MKKLFYASFLLVIILFSACSSNKKGNPTPTKTGSTLDLIKDSVFLYAQEEYLWYNQLPTYATFNPRAIIAADDQSSLDKEVNQMSQYAINPATKAPYEYYAPNPGEAKYSFIDAGAVSAELNGTRGDFGFAPFYNFNDNTDLRVKYVYPGSPADVAGIKRGYRITSINGNSSLTFDGNSGTTVAFIINAYSNSNTISMTLLKPDGTTLTVSNMAVANYNVNPVITYKTFDEGNGRIVGYMVFNSFTSGANAEPQLNTAFSYFTTQGVTDLVVDLRYNGGGYVSTAEYLDNLIVPSSKTGTLMYNTYYNDILTNGKAVLLKNQWRKDPSTGQDFNYGQLDFSVAGNSVNFAKMGSLNVNNVFFIMTGGTASASELTINNLRPEMNVQFIGTTSYGKPVGFFDIDINKYELFTPEFYTQNSASQGGYYGGFTPGAAGYPGFEDHDDLTKDFGDPAEGLLAHALTYVKTGAYSVRGPVIQSLSSGQTAFSLKEHNAAAIQMNAQKFNGMVYDKMPKLKRKK